MGERADEKAETRARIIKAASRLLRDKGIQGLKVTDVMAAADLTHGSFYAHFDNKEALLEAAFRAALDHRQSWFRSAEKHPPEERIAHLAKSYLTRTHRDRPETGCAFAPLAREFAQAGGAFPAIFESELKVTLNGLTELLEEDTSLQDQTQAMGLLSLCVGSMVLARAVSDPGLSDKLLSAAAKFASAKT